MASDISADDIRAALQRMRPHERSFLNQLPEKEAAVFVELFVRFPGIRMEEETSIAQQFEQEELFGAV